MGSLTVHPWLVISMERRSPVIGMEPKLTVIGSGHLRGIRWDYQRAIPSAPGWVDRSSGNLREPSSVAPWSAHGTGRLTAFPSSAIGKVTSLADPMSGNARGKWKAP
jgi:hypothetical protein